MLNIDTSRPLLKQIKPFVDTLWSMKPIILLPFNIWLYFVTLPFRMMFFFTSQLNGLLSKEGAKNAKEKMIDAKEKVMEIKEEVVVRLPEQLMQRAPIEKRPLKESVDEDVRTFGWYQVEKSDSSKMMERSSMKKEESAAPAKKVDPVAELKEQLSTYESHEKQSLAENERLQNELADLQKKYDSDEKTIKKFETEDRRLKELISVEQRKCFDLQQESIRLKIQLRKLEDQMEKASEKPTQMEMPAAEKPVEQEKPKVKLGAKKNKSKKSRSAKPAEKPAEKPVEKSEVELEKEDPIHHPHGWHSAPLSNFTDMVAQAQREDLEHGKTFAETLKESITPAPVAAPTKEEFLVVGGDNSMHHVTLPVSAN